MTRIPLLLLAGAAFAAAGTTARARTDLTIATVNNADMIVMQKLAPHFEAAHPDIALRWVTLEENVLRQRVTTDIATHAGQFDIVTIGTYEVPIWARLGWLHSFTPTPPSYQVGDLIAPVRNALSVGGRLYAVPFYGESTFTIYRKDLFEQAGLTMPPSPRWDQIAAFARKLNDPHHQVAGICLRGKPGWGENMGFVADLVNSFGGRYVDMHWQPQLTSAPWRKAVQFYVDLLQQDGPKGATSNGYNENLALFAGGHCAMWVDATVSAGFLEDPKQSTVAGKVGFAQAPYAVTTKGSHYLWAWTLGVPSSTKHAAAATEFALWATSPAYIKLVASEFGWGRVPPGTRVSTYDNQAYLKAAPYAPKVLAAMNSADLNHPTLLPVPYIGISYVGIPQWQGIGTEIGQQIAAALAGQKSVAAALEASQTDMKRALTQAGYLR